MGFTTTLLDVNYNIERRPYPTRTHSGGEKKKEKKRFPKKTFISFTPRMGSYTEGGSSTGHAVLCTQVSLYSIPPDSGI